MTLFTLASFVYDEHVTIRLSRWIPRLLLGDLAISYVVRPRGEHGSRLIVKLTLPRAKRLGLVFQYATGWLDLLMVSKQMNNIRRLSESHWAAVQLAMRHDADASPSNEKVA
ncbi:hypothetical protein P0W64_19225 [Tsukamurella sp. 8F]|uniref:hypothetical protein n=1 Tax=unclassified Tsukamurella TaxID=2633480 RepID=UPI0023BA2BEA|nr:MULTISPECIES: hypothetical protein [unclassified Tsukamurella]MDF0531672.1 hypothetical protein [Tsukamurella sp. 8J]MDF0588918.1 hypothetical protein [Tsukamurella sp. 8F]